MMVKRQIRITEVSVPFTNSGISTVRVCLAEERDTCCHGFEHCVYIQLYTVHTCNKHYCVLLSTTVYVVSTC